MTCDVRDGFVLHCLTTVAHIDTQAYTLGSCLQWRQRRPVEEAVGNLSAVTPALYPLQCVGTMLVYIWAPVEQQGQGGPWVELAAGSRELSETFRRN